MLHKILSLKKKLGSAVTFAMAAMDVALQPAPEENHKEVNTHGKQTCCQGMFKVREYCFGSLCFPHR